MTVETLTMNESFDIEDPTVLSTEFEPIDPTMADGGHTELNEYDLTALLQGVVASPCNDGDGSGDDIGPRPDRNQLWTVPEPLKEADGNNLKNLVVESEKLEQDSLSKTTTMLINTLGCVHKNLTDDDLNRIVLKAIADVEQLESNERGKRKGSGTCDPKVNESEPLDAGFLLPDDFSIHSDSSYSGDDPSDIIGDVLTFCSVIDVIDDDSMTTSKTSNDDQSSTSPKRGPYKCGRCGQVLKGHKCTTPVAKKVSKVKNKIRKNENLPVLPGKKTIGTNRSKRCGHRHCRQPKLVEKGEPPHKVTCAFCKYCKRHKFDCIKDSNFCDDDTRLAWKKGRRQYGTIWKEYYKPGRY